MSFYVINVYIPASLIVVISWVSFWINRGATPARVGLGVTTVLTMTTLMASTNAALPKVSYVKSIDVFLGSCFFMVFASLIGELQQSFIQCWIQMKKIMAVATSIFVQLGISHRQWFQHLLFLWRMSFKIFCSFYSFLSIACSNDNRFNIGIISNMK